MSARQASSTEVCIRADLAVAAAQWIDDAASLERLVAAVAAVDAYALDTEFHRERTYWPKLALVQLAWRPVGSGDQPVQIALVDPLRLDLAAMEPLFRGSGLAVVHAADQDLEILEQACGTIPARLFDTQVAAGFLGTSSLSLSALVFQLLGVRLPKGDRLTDWVRRPLDDGQRSYAAADVVHLPDLHDRMAAELSASGRLAWAEEECELVRGRRRGPPPPETAWWRVRESRHLRGRARLVAQALAAWRERKAAQLDRPLRHVLSDLAIVTIAANPPADLEDLRRLRGVDGRHLGGSQGKEILEAVAAGLAAPSDSLALPEIEELDRRLRPAVALASAWIAQLAVELRIDATLLATRADLHALLRGDRDARLSRGWRAELVGEPVRRLVEGEAALAFDGQGGLVLEDRPRPAQAGISTTA
ncbi:MAG: ribonuclease D [Acidimicrobiales bacterium]